MHSGGVGLGGTNSYSNSITNPPLVLPVFMCQYIGDINTAFFLDKDLTGLSMSTTHFILGHNKVLSCSCKSVLTASVEIN